MYTNLTKPKSQLVDLGYIRVIWGKHIRPILLYIFEFVLMKTSILVQTYRFLRLSSGVNAQKLCLHPQKRDKEAFFGKKLLRKVLPNTQSWTHAKSRVMCSTFISLLSSPPSLCKKGHFLTLTNTHINIHFGIISSIRINLAQTLWCSNVILNSLTKPKSQLADLG